MTIFYLQKIRKKGLSKKIFRQRHLQIKRTIAISIVIHFVGLQKFFFFFTFCSSILLPINPNLLLLFKENLAGAWPLYYRDHNQFITWGGHIFVKHFGVPFNQGSISYKMRKLIKSFTIWLDNSLFPR